jgi:ribosomal protein S18 acetylase RimI-like enzyme
MADDRLRTLRFLHEVDCRAAEEVVAVEGGVAVLHSDVPLLWDANHLVALQAGAHGARGWARAAEAVRRRAGLSHRMVVVPDEEEALRLARGFRRLGWDLERHLVMALRRPADRVAAVDAVRSLPFEKLQESRAAFLRSEPWGREDVVAQVLRRDRHLAAAVQDHGFAAFVDGRPAAFCRLLSDGEVGQIEDVATLPGHRGRGFARAVVGAAVGASRAAGHVLTFITADADDWPQALYRKLGFDDLTVVHRFRMVVAG